MEGHGEIHVGYRYLLFSYFFLLFSDVALLRLAFVRTVKHNQRHLVRDYSEL